MEKALKLEQIERNPITLSEMHKGMMCVFQPSGERFSQVVGVAMAEALPFNMGDVVSTDSGDTSKPLLVHWRSSFKNGIHTSDPDGSWKLLCRRGCQWSARCQKSNGHTKWIDHVALDTVVYNGVKLCKSEALLRSSAKAIGKLGKLLCSSTLHYDIPSKRLEAEPPAEDPAES